MNEKQATQVRAAIEQLLRAYWLRRYEAYLADDELDNGFLEEHKIDRHGSELPVSVRHAVDYYYNNVEAQDWGGVTLLKAPLAEQPTYIVRTTTDGDDGWLELYGEQGEELGVGRTYIELVAWGEKETIRAQTLSGDYPLELEDRHVRTLWN